jgi:thiol-disulfide isomerase/thioredoxin
MTRTTISSPLILIFITLLAACKSDIEQFQIERAVPIDVITSEGVSIEVYDFPNLNTMLEYDHDTLYPFNFWATWCQPCVNEIPYLDMIDSAYSDKAVRVVLISLNFVEDTEDLLIPFIIDKKIQSKVVLLDETKGDTWMPKVDPSWDGSIPATMFKHKDNKKFRVHAYTYEELVEEVEAFLSSNR